MKSGEIIQAADIKDLQSEVGSIANSIPKSGLSRSILSSDNLDDSIIYCARNFGVSEKDPVSAITTHINFPESIGDPRFSAAPRKHTDPVVRRTQAIGHMESRTGNAWKTIDLMSSKYWSAGPRSTDITSEISTDDWLCVGAFPPPSFTPSRSEKFGERLFKVRNRGNGYSLLFHLDMNAAYSYFNKATHVKELMMFMPSDRFWSSVIYFLKPNKDSTRVLAWSPGHMLAGTGAINNSVGYAPPSVNVTHSYTDIIRVNESSIRTLCDSQGIDYDLRKMHLDDTSYFGWALMTGSDRWDYNTSPLDSTHLKILGGNISFIAFKDDSGGVGLENSI